MSLKEVFLEYLSIVDGIYGVYLDSSHGFTLNKSEMLQLQQKTLIKKNIPIEELDEKPIRFNAAENVSIPFEYTLHECSQKDYKARNTRNGTNFIVLANLCLTQIYSYWEDYYRNKIAQAIGKKKHEIKSDFFGDIRYLRQLIIHNKSLAIGDISKCKIVKWFNPGDKIQMDEYMFEHIIFLVKKEIILLAGAPH